MRIHILAIGQKMPAWVNTACDDYAKRLPPELRLSTRELPLIKRGKNADIARIKRDECQQLLDAVPKNCRLIALDVAGKKLSTEKLAAHLGDWMQQGRDIAIAIGGPDGFTPDFLQQAEMKISLSDMTFPHPLVRVMLTEQLYRAWSILNNHPYHRG